MTRFMLYLAPCWAVLPFATSMTMKQPPAGPPAADAASGDNAMANTYGFLRTANNNVGSTVEGVLNVEGSLTDMKKDLDHEYTRWKAKKKVLLSEREKMNSEKKRLQETLLQQNQLRDDLERTLGDVEAKKEANKKAAQLEAEAQARRANDRKGMEEDIDALKCATKTIQQAKQKRLDAANRKTSILKDANRQLQEQVFHLNKEVNTLQVVSVKQNNTNKEAESALLARIEALQKQIHGLEKELVAQAQLEEGVQRVREQLNTQNGEVVAQREKLTKAQSQCMMNKHHIVGDIEAFKRQLNDANTELMQCQNMDGQNQKLQADLNTCILTKRSER